MKGGSVAKRYAAALLSVAQEQGKLAKAQGDLEGFAALVAENSALREALGSPVLAASKKLAVFEALQQKLNLEPAVQNVLKLMIERDRFEALPLMTLLFRDLADETLGQVRVQVRVAAPLEAAQEAQLKEILGQTLHAKILLQTTVDPDLLGGLYVQVAGKVFDASLKKELEVLKQNIVERAVA